MQGVQDLRACLRLLLSGQDRCFYRCGLDHAQQLHGDCGINSCAAEGDTACFFVVQISFGTSITNPLTVGTFVIHTQHTCTTATSQYTCQQSVAASGCPGRLAAAQAIADDHLLDSLEILPTHVSLMRSRDEGDPAIAGSPSSALHRETVVVAGQSLRPAVCIRSPVSGMGQDLVDAAVGRASPVHVAADRAGRYRHLIRHKPQQSLAGAAEFEELREYQLDRASNALVGLLLEPAILVLDEADRRVRDKLAAARLLDTRFASSLAQKVEFVLIERALQPQEQSVITLAWRVTLSPDR